MNIPGITDLSEEQIQAMSADDRDNFQHLVMEEIAGIQMQLELLNETGSVSRDMATQFKKYLPEHMVLESFTSHPTNTNYAIAKESLSTALKVVAVVGVVAGLGTLAWLFMRSRSRGGKEVAAPAAAKVEKLRDVQASIDELMSKPFEYKKLTSEEQRRRDDSSISNIKKFIGEGDILHVRTALKLAMNDGMTSDEALDAMVQLAEAKFPQFWEPFAQKAFAGAMVADTKSMWDADYSSLQSVYLTTNFSRERFNHVRAVEKHLRDGKGAAGGDPEKVKEQIKEKIEEKVTAREQYVPRVQGEARAIDTNINVDSYTLMMLTKMAVHRDDLTGSKMIPAVYNKLDFNLEGDYKELLLPAVEAAIRYSKSGDDKDLEAVEKLKVKRPIEQARKASDAIATVIQGEFRDARKSELDTDSAETALASIKKLMETPATLTTGTLRPIYNWLDKDDYKVVSPNYASYLKDIDKMLKIGDDIAAQEKRLKDVEKLPREISSVLQEYIDLTKANLRVIDFVSTLINIDITVYNRMLKFVGRELQAKLQITVDSLNEVIADPEVSEPMKAACREVVQRIKRDVIAMATEGLAEVSDDDVAMPEIAMEGWGTAAKVLGAVGLIAVVGALGFILVKMMNGGKSEPKVETVEKVNKVAKSLEDLEAEQNGKEYREWLNTLASRKEFILKALPTSGLHVLGVRMLGLDFGQDNFLIHAVYRYKTRNKELKDTLELLPSMVKDAISLGPDGTVEIFDKKTLGRLTRDVGGRNAERFAESVSNDYDNDYFTEPSESFIAKTLKHLCSGFLIYPMDKFNELRQIRAGYSKDVALIEKTKADLEGANISKAIAAAIREYCDRLVDYYKALEETFKNIDREIEEYNRAGALWSKAVGEGFKEIKARIMDDESPIPKEDRIKFRQIIEDAMK